MYLKTKTGVPLKRRELTFTMNKYKAINTATNLHNINAY